MTEGPTAPDGVPEDGSSEDGAAEDRAAGDGARSRHYVVLVATAAVVLALDQLTKWWALQTLDTRTIDLVGSLRLRLVYNTGAAFSTGDGFGPYIGVAALAIVVVLIWTGRTIGTYTGAVALGLLLGGALGNISDRLFRSTDGLLSGSVIDFIDLQWWPVFNVADMAVVGGAVALGVLAFRAE